MHQPKIIKIGRKSYEYYDYLRKDCLIAGACPDCMHVVTYKQTTERFECRNPECFFLANKDGFKIFSTEMKNKGIKQPIEVP